jgi:tetratricopeptide (TPR) repeat protein
MTLKDRIHEWIEWSRSLLANKEEYPFIDFDEGYPWSEDILDLFESDDSLELGELFAAELEKNPNDIAVRFTALQLHFQLSRLYPAEASDFPNGYDPFRDENTRIIFAETLNNLVHSFHIEDCKEWRRVRWEIMNACAASDQELVSQLFDYADKERLVSPSELRPIRGQLTFLHAFRLQIEATILRHGGTVNPASLMKIVCGPLYPIARSKPGIGLESLLWKPVVLSDQLSPLTAFLFAFGTSLDNVSQDENLRKDAISEAERELRKALNLDASLSLIYRVMLAKCYFANEDFEDAAKQYNLALKGGQPFGIPTLCKTLYESLSACYVNAGHREKGIKCLEECARVLPKAKGIFPKIAELQARGGDYKAAFESAQQENDRDSQFAEDWKYSAILALGGALHEVESREAIVERKLRLDPKAFEALTSVIQEYWPLFEKLEEQTKKEYLFGSFLLHSSPELEAGLRMQWATAAFSKAVELEMKANVFSKFREYVGTKVEMRGFIEEGSTEKDSELLCKFIDRRSGITLGQMAFILRACHRPRSKILKAFREWTTGRFPNLCNDKNLLRLDQIARLRGDAVHQDLNPLNAKNLPNWCRQSIEAMHTTQ